MRTTTRVVRASIGAALCGLLFGCATGTERTAKEEANLATFDDSDFRVYSEQEWDDLGNNHAKDIVVHWPDGRTTQGIVTQIEDLKEMFVFAPDTRIKEHPVRIAEGEWTAVTGFMKERSLNQCR